MAGDTRLRSLFITQLMACYLFFIKKVNGYQCHSDWCNYNEYCCGDDICCDYLTGYWYIWLTGGVLLFSFFMVCCWMRYRKVHSDESVLSRDHPQGYVSYGGDPLYVHQQVHQQPPGYQYGTSPTEMQYIDTSRKGNIPLVQEDTRQRAAAYYPPPYNYIERKPPTAPPYEP